MKAAECEILCCVDVLPNISSFSVFPKEHVPSIFRVEELVKKPA
jgi:hypothetical protein